MDPILFSKISIRIGNKMSSTCCHSYEVHNNGENFANIMDPIIMAKFCQYYEVHNIGKIFDSNGVVLYIGIYEVLI